MNRQRLMRQRVSTLRVLTIILALLVSVAVLALGGAAATDLYGLDYPDAFATPDTTEVYEYVLSWGGTGTEPGQFRGANGMGSDRHGNLYVCDTNNERVQKFDSLGNFLLTFGEEGSAPGQFQWARDVAVDEDGYVYVTDYDSWDGDPSWIQKFDSLGDFVLRWGGAAGLEPGELYGPTGIAIGDSEYVFVADGGDRIQRFTSEGVFDLVWTHPDTGVDGGSRVGTYPGSVYTYWATGQDYLFRHDPVGNIILSFSSQGSDSGQVGWPADLATDSNGNLYVGDWANNRVSKFDSLGNFVTMWGNGGPQPWPSLDIGGIAVDAYDAIYVSDWTQNRVAKYRRMLVGIEDKRDQVAGQLGGLRLTQNYPNPFSSSTTIAYSLSRATPVTLAIYDIRGALVRTLCWGNQSAGRHRADWDGRDQRGSPVGSGVYFCHLEAGSYTETRRMVLLR